MFGFRFVWGFYREMFVGWCFFLKTVVVGRFGENRGCRVVILFFSLLGSGLSSVVWQRSRVHNAFTL